MEKTAQPALLTDAEFAALLEAEGFAVPEGLFAEVRETVPQGTAQPLAF